MFSVACSRIHLLLAFLLESPAAPVGGAEAEHSRGKVLKYMCIVKSLEFFTYAGFVYPRVHHDFVFRSLHYGPGSQGMFLQSLLQSLRALNLSWRCVGAGSVYWWTRWRVNGSRIGKARELTNCLEAAMF